MDIKTVFAIVAAIAAIIAIGHFYADIINNITPPTPTQTPSVIPSPLPSLTPTITETCEPIISEPSVKMHIFNGDRNDAENKARQTNITITDNPRNVMGTGGNLPAFVAYLSSQDIPSEGIIRVSGTYEIHADDMGGGPPSAYIVGMKDNEVVKKVKIETEPKLKEPIDFETEIRYRLDQVDRVEIHVDHVGSWGFFLNLIKFEACKS